MNDIDVYKIRSLLVANSSKSQEELKGATFKDLIEELVIKLNTSELKVDALREALTIISSTCKDYEI